MTRFLSGAWVVLAALGKARIAFRNSAIHVASACVCLSATVVSAQGAQFTCDGSFYQTRQGTGGTSLQNFSETVLVSGGSATAVYAALEPIGVNAIGQRSLATDKFIYGIQAINQAPQLYRLGTTGALLVGAISTPAYSAGDARLPFAVGGSVAITPSGGTFDAAGNFYFFGQANNGTISPAAIYRVDTIPATTGAVTVAETFRVVDTAGNAATPTNPGDFALGPDGNLYAATATTLFQYTLSGTGATALATVRTQTIPGAGVGGVGSAFFTSDGKFFVYANGSGILSQVTFGLGASFTTTTVAANASPAITGSVPAPTSSNSSDGASCVGSDMTVKLVGFPSIAAPGALITGQVVCSASLYGASGAVTCGVAAGTPAGLTAVTVSNCRVNNAGAVVTLPLASLASGDNITCDVSAKMPGNAGGENTLQTVVGLDATTTANNEIDTTNNSATTAIAVIDAVADSPATVITTSAAAQAVPGSVLGNDTVNAAAATSANVTPSILSVTGGATVTGWSIDSAGIVTAPANVAPGNYSVNYQICANPAVVPPACDTATKLVTVGALPDMQPAFSGLPTAAAPGSAVTGTLTCTNNSISSAATQATCSATGATVSNCKINNTGAVVTPPVNVPAGGNLTCTVTATAPANGNLSLTGTTGATNDSNAGNNTTPATIPVIDAVNDPAATITTSGTAQVVPGGSLLGSDTIGGVAATTANVTVSPTLTVTGGTTTTGWTVDAAGNLTAPANVVPGTYSVQYQICSNPAATPAACDTATKQVTVNPIPTADMQAVTTVPANAVAGQPVTVSGTCTNAGPSGAAVPTCVLTGLPAGATQSCSPNPIPDPLPLGGSITCTSTFTAPASGTLNITTTAGSSTLDPTPANNVDAKPLVVTPQADMQATVTGFPATAAAGASVSGTVTCTNNGPSPAAAPTCAVAGVPAGATVSCLPSPTPNPLALGASITCTVSFVVPASGGVTVTGTAGSTTTDPVPANNAAQQSVGTVPQADMVANTTVPASVAAGQPVTVSGTCTNNGPSAAAAPTCALSGLPSGATQSCLPNPAPNPLALGATITCTSTFNAPASGPLNITTTAGSSTADPTPGNNVNTKPVAIVPQADMAAAVSGFPATAPAGSTVSGTVTCTNNGPSSAASADCALGALPAGAVANCAPTPPVASLALNATISCAVSFVMPASGVVTVSVTASSTTADPVSTNNTASTPITALPQADMQAATTVPANAVAGQPVTVSGTCSNAGPSAAAAPTCVLSGLPSGATQSCVPNPISNPLTIGASVTCTSTFTTPASGTLNITTTAGSSTADPKPANNVNSKPLNVTPQADMQAVVSGFPATAPAGTTVMGLVTCTNNGPSPAPGASCTVNSLPSGAVAICTPNPALDPLPVGQSIVCNVSFTAPANGVPNVTITGTAASTIDDPTPANNTTQQSVGIVPIADMQAQTTAPATALAGQSVTVSGTCINNGPSVATTPSCALVGLPAGATQTCTPNPAPATLGVTPPATTEVITCTSTFIAPDSGTITVSTVAGSFTQDNNPGNNVDTKPIAITPQADMAVTISGLPANAPAGSTVTGTISCTNNGPSAAANATCAVSGLPPGASVVCVPAPPQTSLAVAAVIRCDVSFIAPASGTVTVAATAGSSTADPVGNNNTAQTPVAIVAQADMRAFTTVPAGGTATAGQSVTVSGTCTNFGPSPAAAATCVLSGLPAGATQSCVPSVAPNPLAVGSSIVCSSTFVAPASGTLNITTTAGSSTADPLINNNIDVKPLEIVPQADMQATVAGFPANPNAGSTVTGTVTCVNAGPSAADNATCAVAGLPPNATVACVPVQPVVSLAVGSSIVCTATFVVPGSGGVTVTGTAGSSTADPTPGNNVAQQSVGVVPQADMAAVTTVPASTVAGQPVTVSGTCTNNGPSAAATPSCALSGLPVGAVQRCSAAANPLAVGGVITCTSTFPAPASGTLAIMTTAGSLTADPLPANNVDTRAIGPAPTADMAASFPASGPGSLPVVVAPGQTYPNLTLTCTNLGPGDAIAPTCAPTVNVGTVSAVVCVPNAPATLVVKAPAPLAGSPLVVLGANASIVCTFTFTAPGTRGGNDLPPQTVQFTGNTNATNDSNPANNAVLGLAPGGQPPIVIDAVDDGITNIPTTGGVVAILGNDQLGEVTNPSVSATGITAPVVVAGANTTLPGVTINPSNQIVVPAGTPAGTYTVEYRICAQVAPTACDTAIATIVVGAVPTVVVPVPTLELSALVSMMLVMLGIACFGLRRERQVHGERLRT